jgi:hypothetical protein
VKATNPLSYGARICVTKSDPTTDRKCWLVSQTEERTSLLARMAEETSTLTAALRRRSKDSHEERSVRLNTEEEKASETNQPTPIEFRFCDVYMYDIRVYVDMCI